MIPAYSFPVAVWDNSFKESCSLATWIAFSVVRRDAWPYLGRDQHWSLGREEIRTLPVYICFKLRSVVKDFEYSHPPKDIWIQWISLAKKVEKLDLLQAISKHVNPMEMHAPGNWAFTTNFQSKTNQTKPSVFLSHSIILFYSSCLYFLLIQGNIHTQCFHLFFLLQHHVCETGWEKVTGPK